MLEQLRVKNFRLLRDVEIQFEPDLPTVFIGPNASGKSTILEVLDFASRCASEGLAEAVAAHGGLKSVLTGGATKDLEIGLRLSFSVQTDGAFLPMTLDWHLAIAEGRGGAALVKGESLSLVEKSKPLVETQGSGRRVVLSETGDSKSSEVQSPASLAFEAFVDATRFRTLGLFKFVLSQMRVFGALSTAPAWSYASAGGGSLASPRDSLVIGPQNFLGRQGIGLANVLYNMSVEHAEEWDELVRAFRGEFPFVRRLVFPPEVSGSKISFAFEDDRFPGRKMFASEMSDGMIAYLCLLAAVLQPHQSAVLALDEPDAHLHPSALRRFLGLAHRARKRSRLAIVTHSNALIDELRDPARSIRIVETDKTGASIRKLDSEALAAWRHDYSLSQLRQTGLLDSTNSSFGTDE
jgi:predicted ATPase